VLETSNNQEQLIFKHAISTVVTSKAVQSHGERMHTSANAASAPAPVTTPEPTGHN
jgi:host factor-I protein